MQKWFNFLFLLILVFNELLLLLLLLQTYLNVYLNDTILLEFNKKSNW